MAEPFTGEIRLFAGRVAPRNWAFCDGRLLPIPGNDALYALIGITYGGDGRSNFALPDLRGRVPIHRGQGPGLTPHFQGEQGGAPTVSLLPDQIPVHNHALRASGNREPPGTPGSHLSSNTVNVYGALTGGAAAPIDMAPQAVMADGGQAIAHENMAPSLGIQYIIALQGFFPQRD